MVAEALLQSSLVYADIDKSNHRNAAASISYTMAQ
jgi:hypothetical protein